VPELVTGNLVDGRYRVLSRIGTGGMADVYLAEDEQLGRKVALKLLHRRFAEDPGFVERFRREARAVAGLAHPHVVGVYDRGAHDGTYYIAMEYLPGRSLKQLIRQEAPLEPVRAIDLALQILKAARFAHRHGVIHRDLKPQNVIVDDAGYAKVTDFGIARAGASDMTETGSIMGTAQYLSPEQAQGLPVGFSSDIYSVGVILYEMLTGKIPFEADSPVSIALRHISEAPVPPSLHNPRVPRALEQAVLWALNKNPADRPADADAFIAALERIREGIVRGEETEQTARIPALAAALPGTAAGAGAGAAGAGAAGAGALAGGEAAPSSAEAPPPDGGLPAGQRRRRHRRWPWALAALLPIAIGAALAAILLTSRTTVIVPDVVGRNVQVAETLLESRDLVPRPVYQTSSAPKNRIIRQLPLGRARVRPGATVTLYVSSGPGNVTIPSVVGLTRDKALQVLERDHLNVLSVQERHSASVAVGDAVGTDPPAGRSVQRGTLVTLFVSSGPAKVAVPDVIGSSQQAATKELMAAGFQVAPSTHSSASVPAGDVISTNPPPGALALPGSTVALVVSSGPPAMPVPNTIGDTAAQAKGRLQADGFAVSEQTRPVSKRKLADRVLTQSPASGSLRKGAKVTIVVGVYRPPKHTGTSGGGSTTPTGTSTSGTSTAPATATPGHP
jgi:beta-lactam-binding protein with PASTA domain/predicted Ser/Thr protein kinase